MMLLDSQPWTAIAATLRGLSVDSPQKSVVPDSPNHLEAARIECSLDEYLPSFLRPLKMVRLLNSRRVQVAD